MSPHDLTVKLFLQLAVILAACRICGWLGRRVGQTQVVSEMVTGVLLGPSLFGLLAPEAQAWLFPKTLSAGGPHPSMLFTIMVLMAVVTTLMASPLFEVVYGRRTAAAAQEQIA